MTKTPAIQLDPATQSQALERVMRQVLDMQQATDVGALMEVVWDLLRDLGFDFHSCALLFMDEERDWMTAYNIWGEHDQESFGPQRHVQRMGDDLLLYITQTPLSRAPARYTEAVTAWRDQQVEEHALSQTEIEELVRLNTARFGGRITLENYPIRYYLHVPLQHGTFTLRTDNPTPDQFSAAQIALLQRLAQIVSAGYGRYSQFLQLEQERAVQQVRAEVQAMQTSHDIVGVMGLLWEVLHQVGSTFNYMTISVRDPEEDRVHLYALTSGKQRALTRRLKVRKPLRPDIVAGVDCYHNSIPGPVWEEHHTEFADVLHVKEKDVDAYYERVKPLHDVDPWPDELRMPFVGIANRFPQGRIGLYQWSQKDQDFFFRPEDRELLESISAALDLGFTRFLDFQRLERQNRQLRIEGAVERVHAAVSRMERSADIFAVVSLLTEQLNELMESDFTTCAIGLIDRKTDRLCLYTTLQRQSPLHMHLQEIGVRTYDSSVLTRLVEIEGPILVEGLRSGFDLAYTTEPLENSPALEERRRPPRIIRRTEEEAQQELEHYRRRWTPEWKVEYVPHSLLRVPFSHGSLSLAAFESDYFTQEDLDLFAAFAGPLSLGFTRFFDFQRLERQNRQLRIEGAVERVHAAVSRMERSADIVEVVTLLTEQLDELMDSDFGTCGIGLIDREADCVRLYQTVPPRLSQTLAQYGVRTCDASMLTQLAELEGPIIVEGMHADFDFAYTTEPLENSPIPEERDRTPRIVRRTEEEARQILQQYRKRWTPKWGLETTPLSVLRVPFSHGSLSLTPPGPNPGHFTQEDLDLFAAFAGPLSLGFTRFFDFQRLEARNRELEIDRAVEQVQIAVQGMDNSADIVPVIALIARQLHSLGLEAVNCSISLVDRPADRVRVYLAFMAEWLAKRRVQLDHVEQKFGPDVIERLENEDRPIVISGVSDNEFSHVAYMSSPLDSYHGRLQDTQGTTITSRTEEQLQEIIPEFVKRWQSQELFTVKEYWPFCVLRAPFAGGTIALTHHQTYHFTQADARILERFAEAFSLGYARYLDFRRLEEQNRQLEARNRELQIERAVEQVQNAVQNMKGSADLVPVIALIGRQVHSLGIETIYCSISLVDRPAGRVRLYVALAPDLSEKFKELVRPAQQQFGADAIQRLENAEGPILLSGVPGTEGSYVNYMSAPLDSYYGRLQDIKETTIVSRSEEEIQKILPEYNRRWNFTASFPREFWPCGVVRSPFIGGTIALTHHQVDHYTQADARILERFAEAFSLGYARHLDFRQLEARNRQLEIDRAVEKVQIAVQSMDNSAAIVPVIGLIARQVKSLGLDANSCSISLVDRPADRVRVYIAFVPEISALYRKQMGPVEQKFSPDAIQRLENEDGPISISGVSGYEDSHVNYMSAPLDSYHGRLQDIEETTIVSRSEEEIRALAPEYTRRWNFTDLFDREFWPCCVVRTPFAGGTIALTHPRAGHYTPADARILERFAEAFALGYARYLDFRRLEEQNRQLEARNRELQIDRAVEQVQNAVQNMEGSADIVPVIALIARQVHSLGIETVYCSISLVDRPAGRVRYYVALAPDLSARFKELVRPAEQQFGPDAIERLENAEGPTLLSGIPGNEGSYVNYMSAPLDSYYGRLQNIQETTIVSRTETEMQKIIPVHQRRWKFRAFPREIWPVCVVRTPFTGGTIALSHHQSDHYKQAEARILERFAEAFALGYARHLDFRRLEEQNRQLEAHNRQLQIERAVEKVQNAVQSMQGSADIVPVIALIARQVESLGLETTYCSISLVDRPAGRVRVHVAPMPGESVRYREQLGQVEQEFGPDAIQRLENEDGPIVISGVSDDEFSYVYYMSAPLDSYHGRLQDIKETTVVSRTQEQMQELTPEYIRRWGLSDLFWSYKPSSILRTPFAGGTIALARPLPANFTQDEAGTLTLGYARILERFAEAFSLGYARHLDFRRLEQQNRQLEAANRLKSEFLANMSHELRTPMNSIMHFSALILKDVCGPLSEPLRDAMEEIQHNGGDLLGLINDILDLSRVEAGVLELQRSECALAGCIETACDSLRHRSEEKGLELIQEVEDDLPLLAVDERRLTQHVLGNLIENAIKFTPAGQIRVGARDEADQVLFWVADTGIGIPAAEHGRIFDTFHQVDGSTTRHAEGTGLGLAIASKFVELHNGRIWVESQEGAGSTFYFALPKR
ncbi:MAG: hypothetical protein GKR89_19320 [Candidatus Latescibacteria bacterium]|nr:hypothetical protein [Candidatus Latescibacterota bacterium]